MAKHIWTILCTKALVEEKTNNVSLIEIIEQLEVLGVPNETRAILPIQLVLVTLWSRSDLDRAEFATGKFEFLAPSGEVLGGGEYDINLRDYRRSRNLANMNSLPLQGPGIYKFVIRIREDENNTWTEVASLPLEVLYSASG